MPANIDMERRKRRRHSAVRGVVLFSLLQAACAICFWWVHALPDLPGWVSILFAVLAVLNLLLILPALLVLKQRFREIEGGEEDAAAEY